MEQAKATAANDEKVNRIIYETKTSKIPTNYGASVTEGKI